MCAKNRVKRAGMKVSKNVSLDIGLLNEVLSKEEKFSKAVTEALELWLAKKRSKQKT